MSHTQEKIYNKNINQNNYSSTSSNNPAQRINMRYARASYLCQIDCKKEKRRPVCGMDNITYPSRCDLHQTICRGKQVKFQYRGECSQRKS